MWNRPRRRSKGARTYVERLPDTAWWDDYYAPLADKLPMLRQKYRDDDEALGVVEMTQREIEMRRKFGDSYGYEFFVGRRGG